MPSRIVVLNPLILNMFKIHVVVDGGRSSPSEMLEELDGQINRNGVFHTHLHVLVDHIAGPLAEVVVKAFEKRGIDTIDVVFPIQGVVDVQILEKEFLARSPHLLERIDSVDGQRDFGQRGCDLSRERVLTVRGIQGEIDLARKIGLICDTRLEGVAQLFGGVGGVVLVEVRTHDVDVGRKTVARM